MKTDDLPYLSLVGRKVTFINQIVPREKEIQILILPLEDVTIKGGGEETRFWPLALPGTISTSLNGTENQPLLWARVRVTRGRQAGVHSFGWHTPPPALCPAQSRCAVAGNETGGWKKKCPQTQSGANRQRQFSQLHCSCHYAYCVAGSLYCSETEFFTSSCLDYTDGMR